MEERQEQIQDEDKPSFWRSFNSCTSTLDYKKWGCFYQYTNSLFELTKVPGAAFAAGGTFFGILSLLNNDYRHAFICFSLGLAVNAGFSFVDFAVKNIEYLAFNNGKRDGRKEAREGLVELTGRIY